MEERPHQPQRAKATLVPCQGDRAYLDASLRTLRQG